jgi:hypothetical protein
MQMCRELWDKAHYRPQFHTSSTFPPVKMPPIPIRWNARCDGEEKNSAPTRSQILVMHTIASHFTELPQLSISLIKHTVCDQYVNHFRMLKS